CLPGAVVLTRGGHGAFAAWVDELVGVFGLGGHEGIVTPASGVMPVSCRRGSSGRLGAAACRRCRRRTSARTSAAGPSGSSPGRLPWLPALVVPTGRHPCGCAGSGFLLGARRKPFCRSRHILSCGLTVATVCPTVDS